LGGQRRAFLGRCIGQAQHNDIGFGHQRLARGRVLAMIRRDREYGDMRQARQPLADLQAGRAGLAIDENRGGLTLGHVALLYAAFTAERGAKSKRGGPFADPPPYDNPKTGPAI
jgi:hypothetical protein